MNPDGSHHGPRRFLRAPIGLLLLLGVLLHPACVVGVRPPVHEVAYEEGGPVPGEVVVDQTPPPDREEVVTVAPEPGFVWVGGYWGWHGGAYVWVPGGWHRPPRPGVVWQRGYWHPRPGGGHVWVRGRWR